MKTFYFFAITAMILIFMLLGSFAVMLMAAGAYFHVAAIAVFAGGMLWGCIYHVIGEIQCYRLT